MKKLAIVINSTSAINTEYKKEFEDILFTLPLSIIFGDQIYHDGVDLKAKEFYDLLDTSAALPSTSQPSIGEAFTLFEKLLEEFEHVIYFTLSSAISGTYQAAVAAANDFESDRITVFDTQSASVVEGHFVKLALDLYKKGKSVREILAELETKRSSWKLYVCVDDLSHLQRGGRIGAASAAIGSALKIKPVLLLNPDGFEAFDKVRTAKKAYRRIVDDLIDAQLDVNDTIYVAHSYCPVGVEFIKEAVKDYYPHNPFEEHILTPVIGAHVGSNTLGVAYFKK